ncbi:hypothetical protein ACE102_33675 [Bradyrhizobium sp. vgs-9]|uniref:hypothetical protein n=1 Tax=Bradyrhizobium sp. vgs-9 TaxID=208389 RepID=UPI0035D41A4C
MTIPILKIKVLPKPVIKGKALVRFPANVAVDEFITVARANGTYTFGVDYTVLDPTAFDNPASTYIAVLDTIAGTYKVTTLSALISGVTGIVQTFTAGGTEAINANTGIALVNQTVGAAKTLTMPLSSAKTCPVLISDFKGDAGTNNIQINLSGSDKFPGGLTSWTIAADTGSVFLRPIAGVGYAL